MEIRDPLRNFVVPVISHAHGPKKSWGKTFIYDEMVPANFGEEGHVHAHQRLVCCQDHIKAAAHLHNNRDIKLIQQYMQQQHRMQEMLDPAKVQGTPGWWQCAAVPEQCP